MIWWHRLRGMYCAGWWTLSTDEEFAAALRASTKGRTKKKLEDGQVFSERMARMQLHLAEGLKPWPAALRAVADVPYAWDPTPASAARRLVREAKRRGWLSR